ncbi:MAG: glucuronate isomerase, partial [Oscillospiraceae bacterium]|nr:glucuronate isomerase [Oscillospiraceae bacterium]
MKAFMDKDFLLGNEPARILYHSYAADAPIIDYHCHISPAQIADDLRYENITQAWLGGDHYKWRLMRAAGVDEALVTGGAPDRDKFLAFAAVLPRAVGHPVYHWAHLELRRYFGYEGALNAQTAGDVWSLCNETLKTLSVRQVIRASHVEAICTTDDPLDDLEAHRRLAAEGFETAVRPGWRPDKAVLVEKPGFADYLGKLAALTGIPIRSVADVLAALTARLDVFHAVGCRISDHGLDQIPYAPDPAAAERALGTALSGGVPTAGDAESYQYEILHGLAVAYARRGWVMQLHAGALRNNNARMFARLGADTGYDAIGQAIRPDKLSAFLDALDKKDALAKTIVYSLDPNDNMMLTSLLGCFGRDGVPGKMQHGSAWWFNDSIPGMTSQLTGLATALPLGQFIGMTTDSRSFFSYTRHEYFRRILCNLVGGWADAGEADGDL